MLVAFDDAPISAPSLDQRVDSTTGASGEGDEMEGGDERCAGQEGGPRVPESTQE